MKRTPLLSEASDEQGITFPLMILLSLLLKDPPPPAVTTPVLPSTLTQGQSRDRSSLQITWPIHVMEKCKQPERIEACIRATPRNMKSEHVKFCPCLMVTRHAGYQERLVAPSDGDIIISKAKFCMFYDHLLELIKHTFHRD